MSTLRSAIWRIAQSTTECKCAICTSCTGSGRIASPGSQAAGRQPSSSPPAQQQPASPAAARQPGNRQPAQQQTASQATGSQPAAGRQPGSRPPARQQPAGPAAARQTGSRPPDRQQITGPAAMLYTRLRGRAHTLRAALMFLRACADAQVLRARPRAMRVLKRESWVGL